MFKRLTSFRSGLLLHPALFSIFHYTLLPLSLSDPPSSPSFPPSSLSVLHCRSWCQPLGKVSYGDSIMTKSRENKNNLARANTYPRVNKWDPWESKRDIPPSHFTLWVESLLPINSCGASLATHSRLPHRPSHVRHTHKHTHVHPNTHGRNTKRAKKLKRSW